MTTDETVDEKTQKQQAYNTALTRLKDAHREEYQTLIAQEFQYRGLAYRPRPSGLDLARAQVRKLYDEWGAPVLPEEVRGVAEPEYDEDPDTAWIPDADAG